VKVDLPRPRQPTSKEFLEYYEEVHNAIF